MKRPALLLIVLMIGIPFRALAEGEELRLSLRETIRLALQNNLALRIEERGLKARETEVATERAKFDPEASVALSRNRTNRFSTSQVFASEQDTQRYNAGLKRRIPTGGTYELQFDTRRLENVGPVLFQVLNPAYSTDLTLTLTHPLLRGAGRDVTQSEIVIATNTVSSSRDALEATVSGLVAEAASVYWELVYQIRHAAFQRQLGASAQRLVELNQAKVEQGLLAPPEVLVAEAGVAAREEKVLLAEKAVKDAEDQLRRLLNLPDRPLTEDLTVVPTDEPAVRVEPVDAQEAVKTAAENRPELRQAKADVESRRQLLKVARNQLMPGLDLKGSVGLNGFGETFGADLERLKSGSFSLWEAGLTLHVPLGNRSARSLVSRREIEMERMRLDLANREQGVVVEVKEAVRRVETDAKRIDATHRARVLAEKKLEVETEKFTLGLSASHDLLRVQDDLAEAQSNEARALTDYHKSAVNLKKVEGRILQHYEIRMEEPES